MCRSLAVAPINNVHAVDIIVLKDDLITPISLREFQIEYKLLMVLNFKNKYCTFVYVFLV